MYPLTKPLSGKDDGALFKILAVTGSAMFAGVMLAIGVILGGYWQTRPPADFLDWFAPHSGLVMRAIPLVVAPTVAGLIGALCYDWKVPATRGLWLAACACVVGVLGLTMIYFVPGDTAFASKAVALDKVSAGLDTWLLHNVRIVFARLTSVPGIVAINH